MGTEENEQEERYVDKISIGAVRKVDLPLRQYELPNKIIPYRNHMLAMVASNYANNIYFGFTAGDTTKDKDYVFKAQIEGILNYFSSSPDKVRIPGPYTIHMPLKPYTKGEIVKMHLDRFGYRKTEQLLLQSKSCYKGSENGCGVCRSCLRKYVAACVADPRLGEALVEVMDIHPSKTILDFRSESIAKGRSKKELEEIDQCISVLAQ
jgi:7-cyano-7-deazaguanine synthase in queuosine biosynthesis